MNKQVKRLIITLVSTATVCWANGCNPYGPIPLSQYLDGHWEWLYTVTPTRKLTPQSVGYTQEIAVGAGTYVAFFHNDTLQNQVYEDVTSKEVTSNTRKTVLISYGKQGVIKYTLSGTDDSILTVSQLLNPYNSANDTVQTVYRRANPYLYPSGY